MVRALGEDELIEHWTLVGDEWTLLASPTGELAYSPIQLSPVRVWSPGA